MKKMYKYILIITLMMFGFVGEVRAGVIGTNKCVNNEQCFLLCSYNDGASDYNIYYFPSDRVLKFSFGDKGVVDLQTDFSGKAFIDIDAQNELREGICPVNVYINDDEDVPCFDNDGTYCETTEEFDKHGFGLTATSKSNLKVNNAKKRDAKITYNSCVEDGSCTLACSYEHGFGDFAHIYIGKNNSLVSSFSWSGNIKKTYQLGTEVGNNKTFVNNNNVISNLRNGVCPQDIYMDVAGEKEICFEFENDSYCTTNEITDGHFEKNEKLNNTKVTTHLTGEQFKKLLVTKLSCEDALDEIVSISDYDKIYEICSYDKDTVDGREVDQLFIVNFDNKFDIFTYSQNSSGLYEMKKSDIKSELNYEISCTEYGKIYLNDVITKTYMTNESGGCTEVSSVNSKYFSKNKEKNITGFGCSNSTTNSFVLYSSPRICKTEKDPDSGEIVVVDDCGDLLGDTLISEINSYLLYIKIAVPIIIIVMGSIDFGTAFIASDEDKMKKAQKKFIMRLIIGMVIFFIPTIINALLKIANDVWNIFGGSCDVGF